MAVRRIVLRVVATLAAAAVAVAGFLFVHGDFQRWKDESALDGACDGLLDRNVVRDVLGAGAVDVENTERAEMGLVRCEVQIDGGGSADIRVLDTAHVGEDRLDSLYTGSPGDTALSVPVGQGWTGLFGARPKHVVDPFGADEAEDVTVSLVLRCADAGRTKGLSVTVETTLEKTLDDPANRPEFARIATSTAAKASKARRCGARLGQPVRSLGLPVNETEYRPLGMADGTCSGINPGQGVSVATETERGGAPYEMCRLADADLGVRYVLVASFGPYAQEEFADNQEYDGEDVPSPDTPAHDRRPWDRTGWTTAKCSDGPALFTLQAAEGQADEEHDKTVSAPELAYAGIALRTFAERSAKAHDCSAPVRP
ncbi:hypothetical protein ACIP2Y_32800 [Streptomyces sviceus]|uniref:hypothetical protein n=1 Tax=Streptomyces sviceus TaxID=285530 RepID=UPI003801ADC9